MHPSTHVRNPGSQPHLRVGRKPDHARWARQSSTVRSALASTGPRTRSDAPMKLISMHESADDRAAAGAVLTGKSATPELASLPALAPGAYRVIHRRSRFALIQWAKAVPATDTPGRRHICTKACFAALLYVRLPLTGPRTTRPSTTSALLSVMVSTSSTGGHILRRLRSLR
jgi:hypothetical protein